MLKPRLDFIFFLAVTLLSIFSLICSVGVHYEKQKAVIKTIEVGVKKIVPESELFNDCSEKGGEYHAYTNWEGNFKAYCSFSTTTEYVR